MNAMEAEVTNHDLRARFEAWACRTASCDIDDLRTGNLRGWAADSWLAYAAGHAAGAAAMAARAIAACSKLPAHCDWEDCVEAIRALTDQPAK